jgi:hypothetical protein
MAGREGATHFRGNKRSNAGKSVIQKHRTPEGKSVITHHRQGDFRWQNGSFTALPVP